MTADHLEQTLRKDIQHIAGTIGERNLQRYAALKAGEDYIAQRLQTSDCQ